MRDLTEWNKPHKPQLLGIDHHAGVSLQIIDGRWIHLIKTNSNWLILRWGNVNRTFILTLQINDTAGSVSSSEAYFHFCVWDAEHEVTGLFRSLISLNCLWFYSSWMSCPCSKRLTLSTDDTWARIICLSSLNCADTERCFTWSLFPVNLSNT